MNHLTFRITKATTGKDGVRHWHAVASDTGIDAEGEMSSLELFRDFIRRIEKSITVSFLPPPAPPFLGVAHYDNMDGEGVAGLSTKMYIDGNRLKLSGVFKSTALANALYDSISRDLSSVKKGGTVDAPIRISAGWYDLGHKHGDFTFIPKSAADVCPVCASGNTVGKVYIRGQLDHLAATRVPVNNRTKLELETKSMKTLTRKDDAASIVGDEIAGKLEQKSTLVGKSAAMVVKAKESDKPAEKDVEPSKEAAPAENKAVAGVDGVTCPSCESLIDDVRIGDECPECGYKFKADDLKATDDAKKEKPLPPKKENKSFGGATSIDEARAFIARNVAKSAAAPVPTNWELLSGLIHNVLTSRTSYASRTRKAMHLLSQFGDEIASIKGAVDNAYLVSASVPYLEVELDEVVDEPTVSDDYRDVSRFLSDEVEGALSAEHLTKDERFLKIQTALDVFADVVRREIEGKTPTQADEDSAIEKAMETAISPLLAQIEELTKKVAALQTGVPNVAVPQRKSLARPVVPVTKSNAKPGSIRDIARRSVGAL